MGRDFRRALYAKQSEINVFDWACGPTAAYTCLKLLGHRNLRLADVVRAAGMSRWREEAQTILDVPRAPLGIPAEAGSTDPMLAAAVRKLGYAASLYQTSSLASLKRRLRALGEACTPCILSADDGGHWITAYGADERGVWILDPARSSCAAAELAWSSAESRLWDSAEEGYLLIGVRPAAAEAVARWRRGGFPPSNPLFEELEDPDFEGACIDLRADLDAALGPLSSARGLPAGKAFAGISGHLEEAVLTWCAGVDPDWLSSWMAVAGDILSSSHYRIAERDLPRFGIELGALAAATALCSHEVSSGEGCDFDGYRQDARVLLDRGRAGRDSATLLGDWVPYIAAAAAGWSSGLERAAAEEDLRCLVGQGHGQGWRVRPAAEPALLAAAAALVTAYQW